MTYTDPHAIKHHFFGALIGIAFAYILLYKGTFSFPYAVFVIFYATMWITALSLAIYTPFFQWRQKGIAYFIAVIVAVSVCIGIHFFEKNFHFAQTGFWKLLTIAIITACWIVSIELNNLGKHLLQRWSLKKKINYD